MTHANVIVLITPKDQGEPSHPNLWKQQYALPKGRTGLTAKDAVRKMLAPYDRHRIHSWSKRLPWPAGVVHCIGWDHYWIGGGWGGQFDPQYDIMNDPRNQQRCTFCRGTGQQEVGSTTPGMPNAEVVCDLCHGTGRCAKFHDEWKPVDGDIAPVARLPEKLDAYAIITPDGIWHECGEWFGAVIHEPSFEQWGDELKRLLEQYPDAVAVNVDIHT